LGKYAIVGARKERKKREGERRKGRKEERKENTGRAL
jgi:hypothetical protein